MIIANNREEHQERDDELQAPIFSLDTSPNLNLKGSVSAEMEEEHDGIERNEREGCLDSQLD